LVSIYIKLQFGRFLGADERIKAPDFRLGKVAILKLLKKFLYKKTYKVATWCKYVFLIIVT